MNYKNSSKEKIKALVEKYNVLSESERKKYNEEETKNYFIRPMFEALGWDFANSNEVAMERGSAGKRADYEFKLNGITKFFVEAKAIKVDLDLEQHARQAIKYSWNRGVDWAVLTDFESIKIFYAQSESKNILDRLVFELSCSEYISDFETIWLLAKESFADDLLEKFAIKHGKRLKKLTVNEKLFDDLKEARKLLTKTFGDWNKVDQEILEEGVQRILDRLVFIRVLEDRKLEEPILKTILNQWVEGGKKEQLFHIFADKFKELDEIYDSNIFHNHACDQWEEYDSKMWQKVINSLYGSDVYEYDFSQIPADILGGVYESYLGYIAQKPIEVDKEGKSGKFLKFEDKKELKLKSRKKRKEQGIYYTPKFIVDYIIKNTLGEKLKEIKTVGELKKLKVLDPACGSGSFLTRALEEIFDKYRDFNYRGGQQEVKTTILLENIYGVDLDQQAVELARLNLLIDSLDTKTKLPYLKNIRNGNSLISGREEELKKYFNDNWRDKKPFNWEDEFPEVFKQDGFDVIIGNPPYVSFYSKQAQTSSETEKELNYFRTTYSFIEDKEKLGRFNTVMFFIEKTLYLLNNGGLCGFIVDMNIFGNPYKDLRKYILENSKILSIVTNLTGFEGVGSGQVIVIFQKNTKINENNQNEIFWSEDINCKSGIKIKQCDWYNPKNDFQFRKSEDRKIISLMKKINKRGFLGDAYPEKLVRTSITFTGKKNEFLILPTELEKYNNKQVYPLLEGSNSVNDRYCVATFKNYVNYDEKLRDKLNNEYVEQAKKENKRTPMVIGLGSLDAFKLPKIFVRLSSQRIIATYSEDILCADLSLYVIVKKNKETESLYSLKYTLALLNSKLGDFYAKENKLLKQEKGGMPQIRLKDLKRLPLYMVDFSNKNEKERYTEIEKLADKMLDLNKQLHSTLENSERYNSLKLEIEKTDKLIDQKVYELYGLTEEEIKIIEDKMGK